MERAGGTLLLPNRDGGEREVSAWEGSGNMSVVSSLREGVGNQNPERKLEGKVKINK